MTGVADPLAVEDVWQSADSQELVSEIHRLETHLAIATSLARHALHTVRERGGALDARVRARLADPHGALAAVPTIPATATFAELLEVAARHDDAVPSRGGEHLPVPRKLAAWNRVAHAAGATESGLLALRRRLKR